MLFLEKYDIQEKLCETTSSLIYKAHFPDKNNTVIVKVEKITNNTYLLNETKIRKFLQGTFGISPLIDYGLFQTKRFIVYPHMEKTLQNFWMKEYESFKCAYQLLSILQDIHGKGVVHCDISARNILVNTHGSKKQYYLNDFGQSQHFSYGLQERRKERLKGCPMFCSCHVHEGSDYSPRDDLISLGFVLVYCYKKTLPWSGVKNCKDIYEKKQEFKENFWNEEIPHDLKIYMNYCFHLKMNEVPNYKMLRQLFLQKLSNDDIEINIGT